MGDDKWCHHHFKSMDSSEDPLVLVRYYRHNEGKSKEGNNGPSVIADQAQGFLAKCRFRWLGRESERRGGRVNMVGTGDDPRASKVSQVVSSANPTQAKIILQEVRWCE